ncbi:MAG: dephospho-CoA kinase [Planctomycetes bacterium]|nr:dephospho-CoA kinase [Planctomycetota bacterium]MCA8945017.1 dephospho-CoA kinase [Planctomycetota bacterium]
MKPVIALVGGVASGKSAVGACFQKRGAVVVDADKAGHEILHDNEVKMELRAAFGDDIFDAHGEVLRQKLGALVFGDAEKLATLNNITHPRIRKNTQAKIEAALTDPQVRAVVLDISLLLESGAYEGKYSLLVFVEADEASREKRAIQTRGWEQGEAARRQANQLSLAEKKRRADVVIHNNGTLENLDRQVEEVWQTYVERSAAGGH